jgi:hypothetical protein
MSLRPGDRIRVQGWTRWADSTVLTVLGVHQEMQVVRAMGDDGHEHHIPVGHCTKVGSLAIRHAVLERSA